MPITRVPPRREDIESLEDLSLERDGGLLRFERLPTKVSGSVYMLSIFRAKVPGGWLIVMRPNDNVVFMPDPEHQWDGASVP